MVKKKAVVLLTVVFMLLLKAFSFSEGLAGLSLLCTGRTDSALRFSIRSPQFLALEQFDEKRISDLNRLISHMGVETDTDGEAGRAVIKVDGEPLFTLHSRISGEYDEQIYSFMPGYLVRQKKDRADEDSMLVFLEQRFFPMNRFLDDLFPALEKCRTLFPEYTKTEKCNISYTGYGKAVKRMTITFPADFTAEKFPQIISTLVESGESREWIEKFVFHGKQRIVLLLDENERLIRVSYDGEAGISEDKLRRVSVVWRSFREKGIRRDKLVMKTPSVSGYDRNNLTYTCEMDESGEGDQKLAFDYQLDLRENDEKKKIRFLSDLSITDHTLNGTLTYDEKGDGSECVVSVKPEINIQNNAEADGTLEITKKKGKIVKNSLTLQIHLDEGDPVAYPETEGLIVVEPEKEDAAVYERIQEGFAGLLIQRLMDLPEGDLGFLLSGLSDSGLSILTDSIK